MIIETSALVAILRDEPAARECARAILGASHRRLSVAGYLEAAIVIDGSGDPVASRQLDTLLADFDIGIEPLTERQAQIARAAYRDFGKGRGNSARLNFGDCMSYALATDLNEPLLFVGDDFSKTDVKDALAGDRD
ncbi:type II toxin-antitoxin system VapC family toxin [Actinopolymorpha sp. B17G11]|uniref:type II toxin-antitoxin system VapC family toxin n=1 Tax=Actinopolymorpha sp. B17G11 TaxID=3160861 RepID=UPI0032E432B4